MIGVFWCLALLNSLDGIVTYIGIEKFNMVEANPLMNATYSVSPLLFLAIKMALSGLLILLIYKTEIATFMWANRLAYLATVMYSLTFLLHGAWIIQIIS